MNEPEPLARLERRIVAELPADDVGLWEVVLEARSIVGDDAHAVRALALAVIRRVLERGVAVVGFPTPDGRAFTAWPLAPEDAVRMIAEQWEQLRRDPNIGDIAWLARPDRVLNDRVPDG